MDYLLTRESKFPGENFEPGAELKELFEENAQILVVGAGGLGCEVLKNLALCKVKNIFVIDLDTIELSNLNRQFLFRNKDIGKYKAEVASEFIKNKYPNINIKWSKKKIQEFQDDFFKQFQLVIGGLDNIEARRWINNKLHELVEFDEKGEPLPETVIPFVDGGTEGFRGQSRVIIPYKSSCFECSMSLSSDRNVYALCTIAETPRIPEHCIEYAYIVMWKDHHDQPVDKDSIEDVQWIYEKALERAKSFKIEGVTYNLTLGVIKGIIPAIASTNAIIAASTVMESIKLLTGCSKPLNNYFMYMGHEGVYSSTTVFEKEDDCKVCSVKVKKIKVKPEETWGDVYNKLKDEFKLGNSVNVISCNDYLIMSGKGQEDLECKKKKTIQELITEKAIDPKKIIVISDDEKKNDIKIKISLD